MSFAEPFESINTAIIDALDAEGVKCYPYQTAAGLMPIPSAYLSPSEITPANHEHLQVNARIGLIEYRLRHFVPMDGDELVAYQRMTLDIRRIYAALGDASLGMVVRSVEIDRTLIDVVTGVGDGRPMLMSETFLRVRPVVYAD